MKKLEFSFDVSLSKEELWKVLTEYKNYPKYFEYIHASFHKGEMKKGSIWVDLATVVYIPTLAFHKVTEFDKEKKLQFYVPIPLAGFIKETMELTEKNNGTAIKAIVEYEFGPLFGQLFNSLFEKRFKKMIEDAALKFEVN